MANDFSAPSVTATRTGVNIPSMHSLRTAFLPLGSSLFFSISINIFTVVSILRLNLVLRYVEAAATQAVCRCKNQFGFILTHTGLPWNWPTSLISKRLQLSSGAYRSFLLCLFRETLPITMCRKVSSGPNGFNYPKIFAEIFILVVLVLCPLTTYEYYFVFELVYSERPTVRPSVQHHQRREEKVEHTHTHTTNAICS